MGSAVDTTSSDLFYPYHFHIFQCQKQNLSLSIVVNGNKEFFNLRDEKWLKFTMKTNKFIIHTKKKVFWTFVGHQNGLKNKYQGCHDQDSIITYSFSHGIPLKYHIDFIQRSQPRKLMGQKFSKPRFALMNSQSTVRSPYHISLIQPSIKTSCRTEKFFFWH